MGKNDNLGNHRGLEASYMDRAPILHIQWNFTWAWNIGSDVQRNVNIGLILQLWQNSHQPEINIPLQKSCKVLFCV